MSKPTNSYTLWKEYYFVLIPIIITILIYLPSLFFGFRNFDEDNLIKDFYVRKTFTEYIEKFLLLNQWGVSEAHGFTFSGIKNIHVSILGLPLFYLINFLFQAKPFLYHLWGLSLHCLALLFFSMFCYNFTQNKSIALFSGLIWSTHPVNVESVIWATNWSQPLGATFYFFTLSKISNLIHRGLLEQTPTMVFIICITLTQILFTEHTITIPFAIFFTAFYQLKNLNKAFKISFPSFAVILGYWLLRTTLISQAAGSFTQSSITKPFERILFFTPQIFLHQLKLIFFPLKLSIDQIDLLALDKTFLGPYNLLCISLLILFIVIIFISKNRLPFLSFGLLLYLITMSLFIQIIPLYSLSGERYDYFASAFIIFGIISTLINLNRNKFLFPIFIIILLLLTGRTAFRIVDWRNSSSLFISTIKTSHSLYKKGIWTYNLAICQSNENKKIKSLNESIDILKQFTKSAFTPESEPAIFKAYELNKKSIITKALIRISTNYEILKNQNLQLKYLLKALKFSGTNNETRSLIYKNLGTLYFQMNDFNKAIYFYKKKYLISSSPKINFAVAACYLKLHDYKNYENYLKKAILKTLHDGEALKAYGQLLEVSKGDTVNAIKYYKESSILLNSPEPYILLGTAYLKLREIDNAFKTIRNGLYGFPEDPTLLYLNGAILLNKGEYAKGVQELAKVLNKKNTPNEIKIESCNILVNIFLKQNNLQEAKRYNDLALTIEPKNQEALKNKLMFMIR